jgi:AcrR family transcriptional regulator
MTIDRLNLVGARRGRRRKAQSDADASSPPRGYHHGDLRAALLAAAEDELAENGVEGFTLRGCARRAGVSHAAPAHHFKDVRALLTEVAAGGFERLTDLTAGFGAAAPKGTIEHLVEIARGYVTFALRHPAQFRLIFRGDRLDGSNERYRAAGEAAFRVPVEAVAAYFRSADPMADPELAARVVGLWSLVHGFSDLMFDRNVGGDRKTLIDTVVPLIIRQFFAGSGNPPRRAKG